MTNNLARIKTKSKQKRKANIFFWTMFALPLLQFIVFYIIVNAGSIYLAFFKYNGLTNEYYPAFYNLIVNENPGDGPLFQYVYNGFGELFSNFKLFFKNTSIHMFWNSLSIVLISLVINVVVCLLFSYYIYKNFRFSKFYKVILFLPSILSATVLAVLFAQFQSQCLSTLSWFPIKDRLDGNGTINNYILLIFFAFFTGFGPTVLVYANAMSGIPDSLIEASELDGASQIRQFFSVIIPYIWPTIVSYITISIVAFSSNQLALYTFFPEGRVCDDRMLNYAWYLFSTMLKDRKTAVNEISAAGILLTAVVAPLSMIVNRLLTKFGPSEK